jgi:hypothetical protein
MKDQITIKVSVWDAGCLPGVLRRRIEDVERQVRVNGGQHTAEQAKPISDFLGQMRSCLAAVETARADIYLGGGASADFTLIGPAPGEVG